MQALNIISLCQHYEDINHDQNLQMVHILCLIKTRIHHASINVHKFVNLSKYSYISIHDGHGLLMTYDIHMHLYFFNTIINDGSEYITTFNINTRKNTYCICISNSFMFSFYIPKKSSNYNSTIS
jgi:hypothetical protein